jgi:hypothetical protein
VISHRLIGAVALAGLFLVTSPAPAEALSTIVLQTAPPDANFVLLINGLKDHSTELLDSPFAKALRSSRLGQTVAGMPEVAQLQSARKQLEAGLGVEWSSVRDHLLGECVLFAYYAGPPGHPEQERGLILTWLSTPGRELADKLLERLNKIQTDSGELKEVRTLTHNGVSYIQRVKTKGPPEFFLFHRNGVLAISSQELAIKQVIEQNVATPGLLREFDRLDIHYSFASLWLNPRAFDAELAEKTKQAMGPEAAFLATFGRCWQGLNGAALTVRFDRDLAVGLTLAVDKERFPPTLLRLANAMNQPSALNAAFPPNPMLRVSGRLDLPALLETLASFMTPDAQKALTGSFEKSLAPVVGKKNLEALFERFGPDWGICVSAPDSPKAVVPDVVVAVRVKPSADGKVEKSVLDACDTISTLLRVQLNAQADEPIRAETLRKDGVEVRYLTHDKLFPLGVRPAYALRDGFLVIASNPESILRLDFARRPAADEPNRLMIVSLGELARFIVPRRAELLNILGNKDDSAKQIDQLLTLAELFERLELVNEPVRPGQMKLTLKLQPVQSLKK